MTKKMDCFVLLRTSRNDGEGITKKQLSVGEWSVGALFLLAITVYIIFLLPTKIQLEGAMYEHYNDLYCFLPPFWYNLSFL
jgi:hypothetical protein